MTRLKNTSERELLRIFARIVHEKKTPTRGIVVGTGDDAAVLRPPAGKDLLITADALVEGRHFERAWLTGVELGRRLAAVNLSDIAAMGGEVRQGVLSMALPSDLDLDYVKGIQRGVRDHLAEYKATIVGGNISGTNDAIVCDLTLLGACRKGKAWLRACRPGDAIVVVGVLGEARAGLDALLAGREDDTSKRIVNAFKKPTPLLGVAKILKGETVHGAIDVSDGFASDLIQLCEASEAGCEVDEVRLPLSRALRDDSNRSGRVPLKRVLNGGEDYALILSLDSRRAPAVAARLQRGLGVPANIVGRFTAHRGRYLLCGARGRKMRLQPHGWDHLRPAN